MKIGLACVLFSFVALSVGSAFSESLTYDEVFYLEEGKRIWAMREFRDPYNPPLAPLLAAIARSGRFVTVALGVLLILAVYRAGGLPAAAILAFEPTFLAHSHYVTSDVAVTLFVFLAAVSANPLLLGLSVGYALSSKMTSLLFLPIVLFFRKSTKWRVAVPVAIVVLWASYLFTWDVVIREREDPGRVSVRLVQYARARNIPAIEQAVTFLETQPLPLGTYLATVKNNLLRVGRPAMIFFDGAIYERSRWYFMIANVFRKLPIPFLMLIAVGAWYRRQYALIGIGIIGAASVVGMVPLVRFVLPAMPFLVIVAAAPTSLKLRGAKRLLFGVLLLWHIVGTIAQYPHFISYANGLVGRRERRFEVLADSNLDWGQALPDIMRYAKQRNAGRLRLSYFGRMSEHEWRFEDICAFKSIVLDPREPRTMTAISVSNWYYCGYNRSETYQKNRIWDVVADSFLVF